MGDPIRVLLVEDSADDAELVLRQLQGAGYDPVSERVQTAEEMTAALKGESWDVVVSDYSLPRFDAPAALALLARIGLDIPFIVVSGSIGEDVAVSMMKAGAHDYILKQNLTRLVPAVRREAREAENRRQQKRTEQAKQQLQIERDGLLERLNQENEDLAALTRVTANAISTLELDELLRVLLLRVMEVMHADTATILLAEGAELRVRASVGAVNLSDSTHVQHVGQCFAGAIAQLLKPVYVEDAALDPRITDPLIRERGIRSMLGVPLKRYGTLIGVLHADWLRVRPCRDREVHMLEITAERCCSAIQNAQLYKEAKRVTEALTESETRLRRIVDSNMIGLMFWDASCAITEANDAFLHIGGFTQDDIRARRVNWPDLTPLEYRELDDNSVRELAGTGACPPREREMFRKDGSRVPILIGAATLPHQPGQGVAFVVDITERKQAEKALRTSLREKEALLKEVHHRVKNNLQVITSLLRLETGRSAEPAVRTVLKDMQGRIQAMALLHETLYRSSTFASVDLGAYLRQLATQSFRALNTEPGSIQLDLDLASIQVGIDQAIPCGLLLNELLSNCLKHGFMDRRAGGIRIELRRAGDGPQLRLRVSDTGVGLPADFEAKRGHSLGLQLVSDLAKQLGGGLEIEPGPGTVLSVVFTADEASAPESVQPRHPE